MRQNGYVSLSTQSPVKKNLKIKRKKQGKFSTLKQTTKGQHI